MEQKVSLREVGRATLHAFWALFIPVVIWVGILAGIATATEVSRAWSFTKNKPR